MVLAAMPLLRPDVAARLRAAGQSADRGYCAPPRFTGAVGYLVLPVAKVFIGFEILASPGRLTMLDESGLIRRLYLRDAPPANALDESNSGNSVARFDGRTLVVRTTGLNPETVTIKGVPDSALGHNAQVVERMTLVGADVLEIVTTVTAPELYAAPVVTTNRYRRDPGMLLELTFCSESRSLVRCRQRRRAVRGHAATGSATAAEVMASCGGRALERLSSSAAFLPHPSSGWCTARSSCRRTSRRPCGPA